MGTAGSSSGDQPQPGDDPAGPQDGFAHWRQQLARTQELMGELRFNDAKDLLTDLLIDVHDLKGPSADAYLPVTYGLLGDCYLQSGAAAKALQHTQHALELCEQGGDADGAITYLRNLYETQRYLGQGADAAVAAERLAHALAGRGRNKEARRFHKLVAIVRRGEPANRVTLSVDGEHIELEEVESLKPKQARFEFERNRISLRGAAVLTRKGERLGSAGKYDEALAMFRAADKADPFDPQPHYEAGLTLLYLERYDEAIEAYEATEERAPGWFNCRSDLWLATQLAGGSLAQEDFVVLRAVEDAPKPPEEKVQLAKWLLSKVPEVPLAYLLYGRQLAALGRDAVAATVFRDGLALSPEQDAKTRLLVSLAATATARQEKTRLLNEAVLLNGNLISAAMARVILAAMS